MWVEYAIGFGVVVLIVAGIVKLAANKNRYARMSEREFEAEAQRTSLLGAVVAGLHKVLEPKRVEYITQRDKKVEGDSAESGDRPPDGPSKPFQP